MKKFLIPLLIAALMVFGAGSAFAASLGLDVNSLVFDANDRQDLLGPGYYQTSDGRWDASFNLSVSGAQAIRNISLKNETTGRIWSTDPSGNTELLLVKDSSGATLNGSGRLPVVPVLIGAGFKLYINDAQAAIARDSTFTVIVELIDGKEVYGSTMVRALAQPAPPAPMPFGDEGITDLQGYGYSENDLAGNSERVAADGKNDFQFVTKLRFADKTISRIKLTAWTRSTQAEWDTIERNNVPIIIVVDSGNRIVNQTNGAVELRVRGTSAYNMLVQDTDGILSDPAVKAKLTIILSDGSIFEREAVMARTDADYSGQGRPGHKRDMITAKYIGAGRYDYVGGNERMESNLNADRRIDVNLSTYGTVTGIRIKDTKTGKIWDTVARNRNPLLAVTDENRNILNKSDGAVSFELSGSKDLYLWIDEEDDNISGPYDITFVLSNGKLLEASTADTEDSWVSEEEVREVSFTSAKPALLKVDIVGKNKKRAANGTKDTALNVMISGNGSITTMVLVNTAGKGWDTTANNNGRWLLGVREGSKILNAPNGKLNIAVNGTKKYQLLMQDNGILSKKTGKLILRVTWNDGEVTESVLKW